MDMADLVPRYRGVVLTVFMAGTVQSYVISATCGDEGNFIAANYIKGQR